VSGRKLEQRQYAYQNYIKLVEQAFEGVPDDSDQAWVASPKSEIFNSAGKVTAKAVSDHRNKLRHYNISFYTVYLAELHVLHHRQMVERGKMIRIGMPWWRGGALQLYEVMQGDDSCMRYSDGDVANYDMSVKRAFMEYYVGSAGVYFKKDQYTYVYQNLQKFVLRRLTRRMTHMYGNVWRIILGGMPSGAYSTSHGDSWILGAMFFFFFEYVRAMNPAFRDRIDFWFNQGKIVIIVYGDDHVIGSHKEISHLINEMEFAKFLFRFLDMNVKDINMNVPAVTVPNSYGGISVPGFVFLKRYLINKPKHFKRPDVARIVPYRPTWQYYYKIPYGSDGPRSMIDCVLSCMGNAYDSMGTNLHAYVFLFFVFSFLMSQPSLNKMSIREMYVAHLRKSERTDVTRIMRKMNLTVEDIIKGFPSIEDLEIRNINDPVYCKFTPQMI